MFFLSKSPTQKAKTQLSTRISDLPRQLWRAIENQIMSMPRHLECHRQRPIIGKLTTIPVTLLLLFALIPQNTSSISATTDAQTIRLPQFTKLFSSLNFLKRNSNYILGGSHHHHQDDDHRGNEYKDMIQRLDIHNLVQRRGFGLESHKVTTRDGYILTTHRLVNPLIQRDQLRGLIILQHGILCASSFYLLNSSPLDYPKVLNSTDQLEQRNTTSSSLAIALSNLGYDVWLTNFRGTQYSRDHVNPDWRDGRNSRYWSFNVDTLVEYDLAAYVGYILHKTKRQTYTFIGHSLGATVGLGSLLVHQDTLITNQLSCSVLMAPVASTQYMQGGLMHLFQTATLLYGELAPFPGAGGTFAHFARHLCLFAQRACTWLAGMFIGVKQAASDKMARNSTHNLWIDSGAGGGADDERAEEATLRSLASAIRRRHRRHQGQHAEPHGAGSGSGSLGIGDISNANANGDPAFLSANPQKTDRLLNWSEYQKQVETFVLMMHQSVSVQVLKHIVQVHLSGRLSRFNYGPEGNLAHYGRQVAPIYDLSQVKQRNLALAIVSGPSDVISTAGEVKWIADQVGDKVRHFEHIPIKMDPFNHMDLIMSRDAGELVNKRVIEFILKNKCH